MDIYSLHRGRSQKVLVRIIPHGELPHLYQIEWPDIGLSDLTNLTRAKAAALEWAKAETGRGPDGNVTTAEAKQILSRLARGSDPNVRIKSIEALAKIERDERELEIRQREDGTDLRSQYDEIRKISPELAEAWAKEKGLEV